MGARTPKVDGNVIRARRVAKGWSEEDFADKARCSVKTIRTAEKGGQLFLTTIRKIAGALNVECGSIIRADATEGDQEQVKGDIQEVEKSGKTGICIKVKVPHGDFDESLDLIRVIDLLIRLAGLKDIVEVKGVGKGSVMIDLRLTEADARRLITAFAEGKLEELKINEIGIPYAISPDGLEPHPQTHPITGEPIDIKCWVETGTYLYEILQSGIKAQNSKKESE